MKKKHLDRLLRSLTERREVRVDRRLDAYGRMGGFVLGLSDELVLLHEIHEFQPDGCRVFRLRDISGVRSGRFERASEQVIEGVGALDRFGIATMPPLQDMRALLLHLHEQRIPAIVEREPLEGESPWRERFLIGYVTRVGKKRCRIHHFDALGRWKKKPKRIKIKHITCVQLESPYTEAWIRHIGTACGTDRGDAKAEVGCGHLA